MGIGLAFLLEQFDTRVRRAEEVAGILRQPILGRIPRISHELLREGPVVALRHPDGQVAEAFRIVRTNLQFLAVDQSVRSVLITSCVQGEGKSVAVANLAVTMAMAGRKVVVVDADLRRPRQHQYFGIANERGVSTVTSGQHKLLDALVAVEVAPPGAGDPDDLAAWARAAAARTRLYVLPSGPIPPNPGEIASSQRFAEVIGELLKNADMVLVDAPAMLPVGDASAIAPKVDGLLFLVDMHLIKKPQLATAAEQLARLPVRMLGTVVRVAGKEENGRYGLYGYDSSRSGAGAKPGRA